MTEVFFDKYQVKGAYHWVECFGPVHRINAYTIGRYAMVRRALKGHVATGDRILDVGCGDAALTGMLVQQFGAAAEGVDTTALSIDLAREQFKKRGLAGNFQTIDGYAYPYGDETFRAVVCSDVIEHVQHPDQMLREMWRVLAPGGVLVVTTPIRYTEQPLDRMHVQEWFPEQFREFCSGVLGVSAVVQQSHPVALAELYASASPAIGRLSRLTFNVLAKIGRNPFEARKGFRAFSTQTMIATKPA